MPGIARKAAMSSSACAEPPSGPTSRPGWLATILALRLAVADRKARLLEGAREKTAKPVTTGSIPTAARPPAAAIMFCSAMPNWISRSG